ncbi:YlmC/YmxH family sporulation protein [Clostridium carnis]
MNDFNNEENNTEENYDNDIILHSLNALRTMEVIDIKDGAKLGFVKDFVIDIQESKVISLILPSNERGWFSKEEDIEIPWDKVKKAGIDVILVDSSDFIKSNYENNI